MKVSEIVSFTNDCAGAQFLRNINIRKEAYPFDWNIISIDNILKNLWHKFQYFLLWDKIHFSKIKFHNRYEQPSSNGWMNKTMWMYDAWCHKYNTQFPHDFIENTQAHFLNVKKKYARRINRLLTLLHSNKVVAFIVKEKDIKYKKIKIVYHFNTLYPNLKYKIISYEKIKHMDIKQFKSYINRAPIDGS